MPTKTAPSHCEGNRKKVTNLKWISHSDFLNLLHKFRIWMVRTSTSWISLKHQSSDPHPVLQPTRTTIYANCPLTHVRYFCSLIFNDPGFCRNGQCEGLPDEETTMSKGCLVVYSMWVTPRTGDYELHLPKLGQRSMYRHMQLGMKQRVHTVLLQWTGIDEIFTCMSNEHTTAADCINLPFQLRFYANWQAGQMPNWTTALQPSCWLLNND